jgi:hypothetical protein
LGRQQSALYRTAVGDHTKRRKVKIDLLTMRFARNRDFQSPSPLATDFFVYR